MGFWTVNVVLLVIIIFLFVLLSWVWPPDSPWAPWWRTNKNIARAMCRLVKVGKNDFIYDLGCGDGTALITAAYEFGAKGVGIEIDPVRYFIAKARVRKNNLGQNIKIVKDNFFNIDISKASLIFVYLVPKALERLLPKFKKELKPGTHIISYKYQMNLPLVEHDAKHKIWVYKT